MPKRSCATTSAPAGAAARASTSAPSGTSAARLDDQIDVAQLAAEQQIPHRPADEIDRDVAASPPRPAPRRRARHRRARAPRRTASSGGRLHGSAAPPRRADGAPRPSRAARRGSRGCRSAWSRGRRGRASPARRADRRRLRAGRSQRRGAARAATRARAAMPARRASWRSRTKKFWRVIGAPRAVRNTASLPRRARRAQSGRPPASQVSSAAQRRLAERHDALAAALAQHAQQPRRGGRSRRAEARPVRRRAGPPRRAPRASRSRASRAASPAAAAAISAAVSSARSTRGRRSPRPRRREPLGRDRARARPRATRRAPKRRTADQRAARLRAPSPSRSSASAKLRQCSARIAAGCAHALRREMRREAREIAPVGLDRVAREAALDRQMREEASTAAASSTPPGARRQPSAASSSCAASSSARCAAPRSRSGSESFWCRLARVLHVEGVGHLVEHGRRLRDVDLDVVLGDRARQVVEQAAAGRSP